MERVKEITEVISNKIVEASSFLKGMSIHEDEVAFLGMDDRARVLVQHLLNAGVKVRLWEPTKRSNEDRKISAGDLAKMFEPEALAEAIKGVHVILVALSDYGQVEEVMTGEEELLRSMRNKIVVLCTPLAVSESEDLYNIFKRHGIEYIEAGMSGSYPVAEKAQLTIFVGGQMETFEKVKSILSLFGSPQYVGFIPKATAMKQSINLVLAAENIALAYAATYLYKQGLNTEMFLQAIKHARGYDLASKMAAFEGRTYNNCGTSNEDVLTDVTNMFNDSAKNEMDNRLLEVLKSYTEQTKLLAGGEKDFASVYDFLNPPTTAQPEK